MVIINFPYSITGEKEMEIIDWCAERKIEIDNETNGLTSLLKFEDEGLALIFALQFGLCRIDL